MLIDLQLHSTYSDGFLTPTNLVKLIAKQGVRIASLTDHNTVSGLDEFRKACRNFKIKPITGLELYVKMNTKRFNILWYNFDDTSPELHDLLRFSQIRRRNKVRVILKKLVKRGFKIEVEKLIDKYNHYLPINHIINDIYSIKANRIKINKELKNKNPREKEILIAYFKNKKIEVLRESYINIKKILKLRKKIGGQIILNHPAKHSYIRESNWYQFKKLGLDGVEILSPHHSIGAVMHIQNLAKGLDLIATGGSDFHRFEGGQYKIQSAFDYYKIDSKYLRRVKEIIK